MEKKFILGVGCQKGGTTWLHSQLTKSKYFSPGIRKEYHVFDALYVEECISFKKQKERRLKKALLSPAGLSKCHSDLLLELNFYLDPENYFNYFDHLWMEGSGSITCVGDITPSYSALPPSALREIKLGLENKGFTVKVVFLMRDPIERCWSMVRMHNRNLMLKKPSITQDNSIEMLSQIYNNRQFEIRTQYESTIKNLEEVFESKNIFYALYENLFNETTLHSLRAFLDIKDFSPDINMKVNVSDKRGLELPESLEEDIFKHYIKTYEYCESKFGVSGIWRGAKYLQNANTIIELKKEPFYLKLFDSIRKSNKR